MVTSRGVVASARILGWQAAGHVAGFQKASLKKLLFVVSLFLFVTCIGAVYKYAGMRLSEPGQPWRLLLLGLGFAISITGLVLTGLY